MKFETIKNNKKILLLTVISFAVILTIILSTSLAKYRVTQSIKIVEGTINYTPFDYRVESIFYGDGTNYTESNTLPTSGYIFNSTKSYCAKNGEVLPNVILSYDMSTQTFTLTNYNVKAIKCYLYFDELTGIEILATLNGSSSSTFPTKSGGYTPNSVTCTNNATAKFDYVDWVVEVDNVEETTCTVNFESNKNQSFATYLKNKACSTTPTTDAAAKDCLVNENGYRYEGSDPNNYVLFNDELWQIIGVFNIKNSSGTSQDLVKLIKNNTLDHLAWDANELNDWSKATLQSQLNNGYLNATDTTCNVYSTTVTKTCKFSETGLNSTARNMVESVVWNLGGIVGSESSKATAATLYSAERGTTVYSGNPTTWTGKVGLMHLSDYAYAVLASSCSRDTSLGSYRTIECAGNNWLYKDGDQWTLMHRSNTKAAVHENSNVAAMADLGHNVRPTIYLKSSINILGGSGTRNAPYIIL